MTEKSANKTKLQIPKLGLGTNKVGGHNLFKNLEDSNGYAVIRQALDSGIQLLDTAFIYGKGRSEEIIGDVLQDYDRSKVIIATKSAQDPSQDFAPNNKPEFLKKTVDEALKRLKTDYIDIFYIHFPDETTAKDEAVAALNELKQDGKIKYIGVSNFSLEQIKEANRNGQVDIVEDHYSLVHRDAEKEMLPYLQEQNIAFVPYFPLASGLLTGKYTLADHAKFDNFTTSEYETIIKALDEVKIIGEKHNATVAQTILAWYMANPMMSTVIPGARVPEQVTMNVAALNVTLTAEEYKTIDNLFADFSK